MRDFEVITDDQVQSVIDALKAIGYSTANQAARDDLEGLIIYGRSQGPNAGQPGGYRSAREFPAFADDRRATQGWTVEDLEAGLARLKREREQAGRVHE